MSPDLSINPSRVISEIVPTAPGMEPDLLPAKRRFIDLLSDSISDSKYAFARDLAIATLEAVVTRSRVVMRRRYGLL